MSNEIRVPTPDEIAVYIERAHRARSEAFAGLGRRVVAAVRHGTAAILGARRPVGGLAAGVKAKAA